MSRNPSARLNVSGFVAKSIRTAKFIRIYVAESTRKLKFIQIYVAESIHTLKFIYIYVAKSIRALCPCKNVLEVDRDAFHPSM